MQVQRLGQITTGDASLDVGLCDLDIVTLSSGTYLYATTGGQGGLVAYRLQDGQIAREVDRQYFPGWMSGSVSGTVQVTDVDGTLQVVFGGQGGSALLGYNIQSSGGLGSLQQSANLISGTNRISDVSQTGTGTAVYVADAASGHLTTYMPATGGSYAPLPGGQIDLGGPAELEMVRVGNVDYLLASDGLDNCITAFRVLSTGGLQQTGIMGADQGLGIASPTGLETVQAFGQTWLFIGAAGSHSISVLRMTASGGLEATDLVLDTLNTRFGGVQALATAQVGDRVFLLAGGADDGLSLFTLLPDGRLVHVQTVIHDLGSGLMNVEAIDMEIVGTDIQIFVTSGTDGGITQFAIPLDQLGTTQHNSTAGGQMISGGNGADLLASTSGTDTLFGGAGDDILSTGMDGGEMRGGAGADRFVITGGSERVTISDFTAGEDSLDLSDLPMLRSMEQITFSPFSGGARIIYRDQTIFLLSSNGRPLGVGDVFGSNFDWPDRIQILPLPPGVTISDGANNSQLLGTDRADTISGNLGNDTLEGGAGDDSLMGGSDNDLLRGDEGDDTIAGGSDSDTLSGGNGNDTLDGGSHNDLLQGHAGNDTLNGGTGNDTLLGGNDDDSLMGGTANDDLQGNSGRDTLSGGTGHDTLLGGDGDDSLMGGNNDDLLQGDAGHDTLNGGAHSDTLFGGDGDDTMDGGTENDLLAGGSGRDVMRGQDGNDEIWGAGGDDEIWGGNGNDTMGGGGEVDTLYGEAGIDVIWGGGGGDWMFGGGDDDAMGGYSGDDTMFGGDGHDGMWGGRGHDLGRGGAGNDTFGGQEDNDQFFGGDGNDLGNGGTGNDDLHGEAGNDILNGDAGLDGLWGGDGNDRLDGGAHGDTLGGGNGNDLLIGGDGWDQLWGADGEDDLWGGTGDDMMGGGPGNDTLRGGADNDIVWGGGDDDVQYGGTGDDNVGGYSGDDTLYGEDGNDGVWGNIGDDYGVGGAGNDTLSGDRGNDTLFGGTGNDSLSGGEDADVLWGDAGADTFAFFGQHGNDIIKDFEVGVDTFRVTGTNLSFQWLDMEDTSNGTLIHLQGGDVLLEGVSQSQLGADDFLFS